MALAIVLVGCVGKPSEKGTAPSRERENRFNLLFLAVDDLRPELGGYGIRDALTPHLDALAARGIVFEHHYVQVPTCGASRYSMLTGRSPRSSGVRAGNDGFRRAGSRIDPEERAGAQSWPELFRRSGYRTIQIGKISHTPDGRLFAYDGSGDGAVEVPHAWDELATPDAGPWGYGWGTFFAYADGRHREDGSGHREGMEFVAERDEDLPDGRMADAAIARIRELGRTGERFVLAVGFFKPHLPHVAPRKDWEALSTVDVEAPRLPEKIESPYWHRSGEYYKYDWPFEKTRPLATVDAIEARRAYLACVRYVDRQIGRVLEALREARLDDDTIVVVWGDHGWHLGEQAIWGKHSPFERSARSALVIRVPGGREGVRTEALVESTDLYPTLVDLCRPAFRETERPLDGVSLAPILEGTTSGVRERAVTVQGNVTSVRTRTHRLIFREKGEGSRTKVELYDLRESGDSSTDVAASNPELVTAILESLDSGDERR